MNMPINRRQLFRSTILSGVAASVSTAPALVSARELPAGYDASKELERADWKPVFLDEHQNATVIALSDLIIPATSTPGAKEALVNRFLDLLMSAEVAETQRAFIAALAYIDGECMQRYNAAFVYVPVEQQREFLTLIAYPHSLETWREEATEFAGHEHFTKLKTWIVGAYYSSPVGLKEIGWDGTFPHGVFSGCTHGASDHKGDAAE